MVDLCLKLDIYSRVYRIYKPCHSVLYTKFSYFYTPYTRTVPPKCYSSVLGISRYTACIVGTRTHNCPIPDYQISCPISARRTIKLVFGKVPGPFLNLCLIHLSDARALAAESWEALTGNNSDKDYLILLTCLPPFRVSLTSNFPPRKRPKKEARSPNESCAVLDSFADPINPINHDFCAAGQPGISVGSEGTEHRSNSEDRSTVESIPQS